jgi:hypothetical protein
MDIHLVLDNYAAHKHPAIAEWLAKRRQAAATCTSRPRRARG